jgi:hypothetical protein
MTTPPAWLEALFEEVMNGIEAHSPGTFGYRYGDADEDGLWEILLYPTPVELHGGTEDGALVAPRFSLDVKAVCDAFDVVDSLYWTAHSFGLGRPSWPICLDHFLDLTDWSQTQC